MAKRTRVVIDGSLYECSRPGAGGRRVCELAPNTAVIEVGERALGVRLTPASSRALDGAFALATADLEKGVLRRHGHQLKAARSGGRGGLGRMIDETVVKVRLSFAADCVQGALEVYGYEVTRVAPF
jgi:hypothetical protein